MTPDDDHVIFLLDVACQLSPPLGERTVTVGVGGEEIVKSALLESRTVVVCASITMTLACVVGWFGTVHA